MAVNWRRAAEADDYRRAAQRRLPRVLFDYIDGGSYAETTLRRNTSRLADTLLTQRVMRDMSSISMGTELFGERLSMPVVLGPVGFAGMYARRGEVQAAQAALNADVPFCLSTVGICSIEEVSAACAPPWFQLYMIKDRDYSKALIQRAAEAGCPVLVVTADLPTPGARYKDQRSGMAGQPSLMAWARQAVDGVFRPHWAWDVFLNGRPHTFGNLAAALPKARSFADAWEWIGGNFDRSVTWDDIDFIKQHWPRTLVVKGVMHPDDAIAARDAGADAVIVSNHGGRQLDGVEASIDALPRIADVVGGDVEVLMDGGVRSGLDVLKALNRGAKACLLGRAWAFALAAGGGGAVERMLEAMRSEIEAAMVLSGMSDVRNVGRYD
ncbi:MAG: L-lactate dehydrogenase [Pseudomonadota bacterium]